MAVSKTPRRSRAKRTDVSPPPQRVVQGAAEEDVIEENAVEDLAHVAVQLVSAKATPTPARQRAKTPSVNARSITKSPVESSTPAPRQQRSGAVSPSPLRSILGTPPRVRPEGDPTSRGDYKGQRNARGAPHGHGTQKFDNGNVYVGHFRDGVRHGEGRHTWSSGEAYSGSYEGGHRHGRGAMRYENGDTYVGSWEKGKQHGKGVYAHADGAAYEGEWRHGKMHGHGIEINRAGRIVRQGQWYDDTFVESFPVARLRQPRGALGTFGYFARLLFLLAAALALLLTGLSESAHLVLDNPAIVEGMASRVGLDPTVIRKGAFSSASNVLTSIDWVENISKSALARAKYDAERFYHKGLAFVEPKFSEALGNVNPAIVAGVEKFHAVVEQVRGKAGPATDNIIELFNSVYAQIQPLYDQISVGISTMYGRANQAVQGRWKDFKTSNAYTTAKKYWSLFWDFSASHWLPGEHEAGASSDPIDKPNVASEKEGVPLGKRADPSTIATEPVPPRAEPASPRAEPGSPRAEPGSPRAEPASPRAAPASPRAVPTASGTQSPEPAMPREERLVDSSGEDQEMQERVHDTLALEGGSVYVGEVLGGVPDGVGEMVYGSGNVISSAKGSFKNGRLEGRGEIVYKNGDKYEGQVRAGKREGPGKQTFANGDVYAGRFRMDKIYGQGKFESVDGSTYDGAWRYGKREGRGKAVAADGTVREGTWKADAFVDGESSS